MAEHFQSRLDSVFGAISGGWSVSKQIERREWRRMGAADDEDDDNDDGGVSSRRVEEEQQDEDEESDGFGKRKQRRKNPKNMDEDMEEIEAIVGMDAALDSEDEEDEYDQLAAGTQGASSRLYMKEVGVELGNPSSLPTTLAALKRLPRDRRAYHEAAASRLEEDRRDAERSGVFQPIAPRLDPKVGSLVSPCLMVDGKRKNSRNISNDKRVRFVDGTKTERQEEATAPPREFVPDRKKNLPDHLKNPQKYTHYFIDWNEAPESNASAWRATVDAVDGSKNVAEDGELPKSVAFVPRGAKRVGPPQADGNVVPNTGVVIAAAPEDGDDYMSMDDDNTGTICARASRKSYRIKEKEASL